MSTYLESFRASDAYKALLEQALLKEALTTLPRAQFRTAYHYHRPSKYPDECTGWAGYPNEQGAWFTFLDDLEEAQEARKERLAERLAKAAEGTAYQDFDFYSLLP